MAISQIVTNSIAPSQTLTTPIVATTMGVGGATPAASGSGISFPATQSASTDVNTLDDYEEGTWTPIFVSSGYSFTYSYQNGWYVKIGQFVWLGGTVGYSSKSGSGSNPVDVGNFPFSSKSGQANELAAFCVGYASGWSNCPTSGYVSQGGNSYARLTHFVPGTQSVGGMTGGDLGTASYINFSVCYQCSS